MMRCDFNLIIFNRLVCDYTSYWHNNLAFSSDMLPDIHLKRHHSGFFHSEAMLQDHSSCN